MRIFKRVFPFIAIFLLILIVKNNISSIFTSLASKNSAASLEEKLAEEKKKNRFLKERLSYVKSPEFVKEEAQERLGLLRPGEYFVIAPTPAPAEQAEPVVDDRPTWKKWWELFF